MLGSYFPYPSPNGICSREILMELNKEGFNTFCIAINSKENPKKEEIDQVEVIRINKSRLDVSSGKNTTSKVYVALKKLLYFSKRLLLTPLWPLITPINIFKFYQEAKGLHIEKKIDCIVAVYNPIESLIAGAIIKKKYPNISLIYYCLDSISAGVVPRFLTLKWTKKTGLWWEKKLYRFADKIIIIKANKNTLNNEIRKKFARKIKFLDIPLVRQLKVEKEVENVFSDDSIDFVYTGSLSRGLRMPDYFLKMLENVSLEKEINFHVFGNIDNETMNLFNQNRNKNFNIKLYGHVDLETAYSAMSSADALVNFSNRGTKMIPSKIFEYISIGKPIVSFYDEEKNDSCYPYFEKYDLALQIQENSNNIKENSVLLLEFMNSLGELKPDFDKIMISFKDNTPKPMVDEIKKVLDLSSIYS